MAKLAGVITSLVALIMTVRTACDSPGSDVQVLGCLACALTVYGMLMLSVVQHWSEDNALVEKSSQAPDLQQQVAAPQSRYTKSNMFMLRDAFCNFTNGELICHRAIGFRHGSQ